MKTALIVGATGVVGKELVALLCDNPAYQQVIVWVRRKPDFTHPKLLVQQVDFDRLSQQNFPLVDEVFCTLGTTIKKAGSRENFLKVDVQYPTEIATLAKNAGVPHFVFISALGANPNAAIFYSKAKGMVEENIKALQFNLLQIVRPGLIVGERSDFRFGEKTVELLFKFLPRKILKAYHPMTGKQIAQVMMNKAQQTAQGVEIYTPQLEWNK
ncbi:NAD(P)H-binding protein [Aggregatibacter kilianii]|uniref:NAD(P)H-binding protein n=1 Tax=Aggregatibacter kilianii TaxID=2025884 RepID=UPI000D65465F|nr:NAD(P)H-binding protein [Aggregatibacter kilianii]